jgi:hypothetical protein
MMTMAITQAKIGRSIKNFAMNEAPRYWALALEAAFACDAGAAAAGALAPAGDCASLPGNCAGTAFTGAPGRTR